jgi:hypothetical protein
MAYQINKTDGTIIATVADGQIDTLSTDITLIGKNYSGFGEAFNENLVKILENFASTSAPLHPLKGQVWFDNAENKLKVYNGTAFIPVSSATISSTQPETLSIGDLWFDDVGAQLYFFDGTQPILIGPSYSTAQGKSGLEVASILDTLNQTRVIIYLYNNGILLGIFSKDSFTPKIAIIGFSGNIEPGFNSGTLANIKFRVTCTNSEQLGGVVATTYARRDTSNTFNGQVSVGVDAGIVIGSGNQMNLLVSSGDIELSNFASDRDLFLTVRKGIDQETAVAIDSSTRTVSIYSGFLTSSVNVGGSLVVAGDLTVEGTTTTINTANVTIEDKTLTLANVAAPSETTATGAGIIIRSTGADSSAYDKEIVYRSTSEGPPPTGVFDVSEDLNLAAGKQLQIGGIKVIDGNSLGSAITSIPGVSSFGTQTVINVGPGAPPVTQMRLENHRISTVSSNFDIELEPDGTGNVVLIGSPRITGMQDPIGQQDASTKEYVDITIESRSLIFSMDLSDGKSNSYIINNVLNNLAPVAEFRNGTYARILCTLINPSSTSLAINPLASVGTNPFLTDLVGSSSAAVTSIAFSTATIAAASVSTTRIIKTFQIVTGAWVWQTDLTLPP